MFNEKTHALVRSLISFTLILCSKLSLVVDLHGDEKAAMLAAVLESTPRELSIENEQESNFFLAKPTRTVPRSLGSVNVSLIPKSTAPISLFRAQPLYSGSYFLDASHLSTHYFVGYKPKLSALLDSTAHIMNEDSIPTVLSSNVMSDSPSIASPISSFLVYLGINGVNQLTWEASSRLVPTDSMLHSGNDDFTSDSFDLILNSEAIALIFRAENITSGISGTETPYEVDFSRLSLQFRLNMD